MESGGASAAGRDRVPAPVAVAAQPINKKLLMTLEGPGQARHKDATRLSQSLFCPVHLSSSCCHSVVVASFVRRFSRVESTIGEAHLLVMKLIL
jgi:hypothetical protein